MEPVSAQRTLVKSPPELWARLSDVEELAQNLGEFGEIRITRLEAERTVVWEGERASGTVELEPSGWGTRVTLQAELTAAEGGAAGAEPEPPATEAGAAGAEPDSSFAEPDPPAVEPEPSPAEPPVAEVPDPLPPDPLPPDPEPPAPDPPVPPQPPAARAQRPRLLGRLFRRRQRPEPAPLWSPPVPTRPLTAAARGFVDEEEPAGEPHEPDTPTVEQPAVEPAHVVTPAVAKAPDEPEASPEAKAAAAVLEGVLDALGAAHHRPFSRG